MGVVSMSSDSIAGPSEAPQPPATPTTGAHGCFSHRDVKCGTLLCLSDNTSPVLGDGSYSLFFGRFKCKAVIASNDANEVVAKLRLVPTGAKCGEEMVSVLAALVGWWWGGDHWLWGPWGSLRPPLPVPRSAMLGAARTSWSTATRTARPSATTMGYAVGSSSPRTAVGPGRWSQPLRDVHHPDAFLPYLRCATTSGSVTASQAGQHPTANRRFRRWQQVRHPLCVAGTSSLVPVRVPGREPGEGVGTLPWCR